MTELELKLEWQYRFDERAGLLAEDRDLTAAERNQCRREANQAILALSVTDDDEENYMTPETTATKLQNL